MSTRTYGPAELRIRWIEDAEPYDPGDGVKVWEHAASLWSIVGDADYHRQIERELMAERSA